MGGGSLYSLSADISVVSLSAPTPTVFFLVGRICTLVGYIVGFARLGLRRFPVVTTIASAQLNPHDFDYGLPILKAWPMAANGMTADQKLTRSFVRFRCRPERNTPELVWRRIFSLKQLIIARDSVAASTADLTLHQQHRVQRRRRKE